MGAVETTLVQLASDQDVEALVERLPALGPGQQVVVSVQDESSVLLTAAEFSRILTAARAAHVGLAISTGDHLRRELARMLGWSVADRPSQLPPPRAAGSTDDLQHSTDDLATYIPVQFPPRTDPGSRPHRTQTGSIVLDPSRDVEAVQPPRSRTHAPHDSRGEHGGAFRRPGVDPREESAAEVRSRRLAIGAAIAAPIVVLVIVAGLLYYLVPTATVTLVPKERAIAADLTYGVAVPGSTVDITLPPTAVTATVTFDRTIQTTGERFVPDGTASGSILFTNPTTQPISVPAQTQLKGSNGMVYLTQQAVTVPPADPYTSLSIGSVTAKIVAAKPGLEGNADASVVLGQLPNGAFFNNREAITGGTRKRIAVVSPADTAALTVAAQQDFAARLEPELMKQINPSMKLVPGSMQKQDMQIQFDHQAGEDATTITGHATQSVQASVFDPGKLAAAARDEVGRRLAGQAGGAFVLLAPSVKIGDPSPTNSDQTAFSIHAAGTVRAVITDQERQSLARQLVGRSLSDADQIVAGMADVAGHRISEGPTWLPRQMPQILSRIRVIVSDGGQANANP